MATFNQTCPGTRSESSVGAITNNANTILSDSPDEYIAFLFTGVTVPQGATINSATLTVTPISASSDEPLHTFWCEDADTAAAFTGTSFEISGLAQTTASVLWDDANLGADGTTQHDVSDLASVVQEVVNRAGWVSGNDLKIVCSGSANVSRDFSCNGANGTNPPSIVIDYTAGGGVTVPVLSNHYNRLRNR